MGISKNRLSEAKVRELAAFAFEGQHVAGITEMTAGLCNALYGLTFEDGRKTVLKVGTTGIRGKTKNEQWLMKSEVEAMRIIAERAPEIPAPRVLFSDDSLTRCSGPYFFMEFMEGTLMRDAIGTLPREVSDAVYMDIGRKVRRITDIKGEKFGVVGSGITFDTQYEFVRWFLENFLSDLERFGIGCGIEPDAIRERLERDRTIFDEVERPAFVHYDIWENNILLRNGKISAIIDWERTVWGDPLMEERFRGYCRNENFYRGFGLTNPTGNEVLRSAWYDVLMDIAMIEEPYSREYEDKSLHERAKGYLREAWKILS